MTDRKLFDNLKYQVDDITDITDITDIIDNVDINSIELIDNDCLLK